jgi:hypothetical protein
LAGRVARMRELLNAYKILVREYEAKKSLERLRRRWEKGI